jgi:hypothetical protein
MPKLDEQRYLVRRLNLLSSEINEAVTLRKEASDLAAQVMMCAELRIWPSESVENAPTLESLTTFLARGRQAEQGESDHYLIKTQHVQQDRYVPTMLRLAAYASARVDGDARVRDRDSREAASQLVKSRDFRTGSLRSTPCAQMGHEHPLYRRERCLHVARCRR